MKKIDYLKYSITKQCYLKRSWMLSAFAVFADKPKPNPEPGTLVKQPWGVGFVNDVGEVEKIDDSIPNQPLFSFKERLMIDNSWAMNCKQPTETSIGTLMYNLIAIVYAFGAKLEYINGVCGVKATEALIAPRLKDDPPKDQSPPEDPSAIYVHEYLKYGRGLEYLKTIMLLCSYSSTPKGIVPPTGLKEFKAQLDKKYEGKLRDPVMMAAYEKELLQFDAEFLKDDPSYGKFSSGKITNTSRKKLFLAVGTEHAFKEGTSIIPITKSLAEGWPDDEEQYVSMINGTRVGSYSRGAETVNGGVAAKYLLRAANNFIIGKVDDCGSKLGILRVYTEANKKNMVGRTVIDSPSKQTKIEKDTPVDNYLGKVLRMRSSQYCLLEGDNICKACAGDRLSRYTTGVTIPLTEVSAIILATAMAKMHSSGLSTARMTLSKIMS